MNRKKIFSNLVWSFLERILAQLVAFVVSIILARILEPDALGTMALITVFTSIFQVFVDGGLGVALIQKSDADDLDFSTVFYTNVVFCALLYLIIYLVAPYVARFYDDLSMTQYIRVLGLTVLISGVKNVQQAYVARNMLFKKFFWSTFGGTVVAGISGISMALLGFGLWALVSQQIINLAIDTIILWFTVKWRPKRIFSLKRLKILFTYGYKILLTNLISTIYEDLRQLIIGKIYTTEDLAFFSYGEKIPRLVIRNINTSINNVLFPAMADKQNDKIGLKNMVKRSLLSSMYLIAPMMIGCVAIADTLVKVLLTDKWIFAIPYLRIFCLIYLFWPVHTVNLNVIKASGRSDIYLKLEILKKILDFTILIITMRISVLAMALSLLFNNILGMVINTFPNKKLINYGYLEQIKDVIPILLLSTFMGVIVWAIELIGLSDIVTLSVQVFSGIIIYILGSKLLKIESYNYFLSMIREYHQIKKKDN